MPTLTRCQTNRSILNSKLLELHPFATIKSKLKFMPEIQPIDDSYIDGVIKAAGAYNPNLSKTQGVRLRELIKLMRDRFEQQLSTGSVAAESVPTYAAMFAKGIPSSMKTYEVAADEKRNLTNAIYQWWPDGKLFFIDTVFGSENIPTQTLPGSTRALPFTCDPTTIESFTTSSDVVFSLDETNSVDGASVFLAILQNNPVDFPVNFIELAGSKQPVLGKMNYYIVTRLNGTYQFIRYQNVEDTVENAIVVGTTQLTINSVSATTAALSWAAATNATQYLVKRYTTANYSDAPFTVYTGPNLSVTDTGLTANTHYYYKINPISSTLSGRAAFADTTTSIHQSAVTLYEKTFDSVNDTGQGIGAEGNYEVILDEGVKKLHLSGRNEKQQVAGYVGGDYSAGDTLRITLSGIRIVGSPNFGIYLTGGISFSASDIEDETLSKTFIVNAANAFYYFGLASGDQCDIYVRSIKIEKINNIIFTKLTGLAFGTNNYSGTPNGTYDKMFDGDLATFFDATDGSNGYAGLDLGTAQMVDKIKVAARATLEGRSHGMVLQGSNTSTSEGYVDLFTIPDVIPANTLTEYAVNNTAAYRYYRMYSSQDGYCNLSEAEFYTSSDQTNGPGPESALQVVKLNLTASPDHTSLPDWNNYDYGMTPEFLNNTQGVTTGIKFIVDSGPVITENLGFNPPATNNFPGSISSTLWYQEAGGITNWHFTGLDNSKSYSIKTLSFDNSNNGETSITWGGITQNTLSFNNTIELTFSNIAPVSGEIAGSFGGSGVYTVINGIVLIEDANDEGL